MLLELGSRFHDLVFYVLKRLRADQEGALSFGPHMHWEERACLFSIVIVAPFKEGSSQFFYHMISRWLVPGKRVCEKGFFAAPCSLVEWEGRLGFAAEVLIEVCAEDVENAKSNLMLLEEEICLGVVSTYHARRIVETRVFSVDEKKALVREAVALLIRLRPCDFDFDLFEHMQQFFVAAAPSFCVTRGVRPITRVISYLYLFRKFLERQELPSKRRVSLKLVRTSLGGAFGERKVLGICVAIHGLIAQDRFDVDHVMQAVQDDIPGVRLVADSFVCLSCQDPGMRLIYLEVEKADRTGFYDIRQLQRVLPQHLCARVERLAKPLFMPRNEEEVMRCIITLSQQLKRVRDFPQVVINFDKQTEEDLVFTVILARIAEDMALDLLAKRTDVSLDRVKQMGFVRNRYRKQALVFRVTIPLWGFVRSDHVVDLYKARREVLSIVEGVFGEVRDYNGGMIARESEVFARVLALLAPLSERKKLILETFFHGIFPAEWRSVASCDALCILFRCILKLCEPGSVPYFIDRGADALYVAVKGHDNLIKEVEGMQLTTFQLLKTRFELGGELYSGYILFCPERQEEFLSLLSRNG